MFFCSVALYSGGGGGGGVEGKPFDDTPEKVAIELAETPRCHCSYTEGNSQIASYFMDMSMKMSILW